MIAYTKSTRNDTKNSKNKRNCVDTKFTYFCRAFIASVLLQQITVITPYILPLLMSLAVSIFSEVG